jgi:hypothetical protein
MDRYVFVQRYAAEFFDAEEASLIRRESRRKYYRLLAKEALRFRERAFWRHHQTGLNILDATFDWPYLALQIVLELLWIGLNPGKAMLDTIRSWKRRKTDRKSHSNANLPGGSPGPLAELATPRSDRQADSWDAVKSNKLPVP